MTRIDVMFDGYIEEVKVISEEKSFTFKNNFTNQKEAGMDTEVRKKLNTEATKHLNTIKSKELIEIKPYDAVAEVGGVVLPITARYMKVHWYIKRVIPDVPEES